MIRASLLVVVSALLVPTPSFAAANAGVRSGLYAAAASSGRPRECISKSRRALARGLSIWEAARVPMLQQYCDLMARAQTQLLTQPKEAKASALEAERALPGYAAPMVVVARASLALSQTDEAVKAFEKARSIDPRSVEDPPTMHDLGRALRRSGKVAEALVVYRALVPRIDLLGSSDRRVAVLLEAAHISMTAAALNIATKPAEIGKTPPEAAGPKKPEPPRLDEALSYLREARRRPPTPLTGDVILSLALLLDRAGEREQADAALAEARHIGARLSKSPLDYLASPEDKLALEALGETGAEAQKLWESYLAGPGGKGPFARAARARLDAAKKSGHAGAAPRKAGGVR